MAGAEKISITICGDGGCGVSSIQIQTLPIHQTADNIFRQIFNNPPPRPLTMDTRVRFPPSLYLPFLGITDRTNPPPLYPDTTQPSKTPTP
jgi:hypothetical protein